MPVDTPFAVYQDQLSAPSHGLALWNPSPQKKIYNKVSIGDVGYLHDGTFIRMFNVILPWDHPSNRLFGKPEPYEPLDPGPFTNTIEAHFDTVDHCSRFVTAEPNAGNPRAMSPEDAEGVTYKFRNRGAFLSLPNGGRREDIIGTKVFEDHIGDHVDWWFTWAQNNKLGVEKMEDLILVTGCTMVTSWAAAAFVDNTFEAEISLASRSLGEVGTSFIWANIRGRVSYHNSRINPQDPLAMEDQCVFIRGFRAKRLLFGIRIMDIGGGSRVIPFRRRTQRNNGLRSAPSSLSNNDHRGSSSSLDTIRPINHENSHWQLLPYPSSTTLPNNGSVYNASFMTSPSYGSLMEVLNDIAEVRHEDAFDEGAFDEYAVDEDTTSVTHNG